MGIYIKGLIMPSCCDGCTFSDWSNLHQTASCKLHDYDPCFADHSREYTDKRADFCPLVEIPEPHGDLIDRDALVKDLTNGIKAGLLLDGYEKYQNINDMDDCVECVKYTDAVIEAEGREDE